MINAACTRPRRKLKRTLRFLLLALLCAPSATTFAKDTWHLLIEPTFQGYTVAWPIPSAETTVLVPARVIDGEVVPLRRDQILPLGVTRRQILDSAPAAASAVLDTLKPEYIRDDHQVILYAVIQSDDPLTASAVLAPGFAEKFRDTLGTDLLIAIPNRNTIFIFSRQSPVYRQMSELIIAEYKSSATPASRELFTLRQGRLIAVGSYQ